MADPFVAEIRVFGFNFPPKGWAQCNGQVLPISQNTALFSLLGTIYGGDGKSTFALPDLQGRMPLHPGQGPERYHDQGSVGGAAAVTLSAAEIPVHSHEITLDRLEGSDDAADSTQPRGRVWAAAARHEDTGRGELPYAPAAEANALMAEDALVVELPSGGEVSHNNLPPYLALNFCIALQGVFPQRP